MLNRIDNMIIKEPVAMKCAFGENPKRCYRQSGISARMSVAGHLRNALFKAKEYLQKKRYEEKIQKVKEGKEKKEAKNTTHVHVKVVFIIKM